MLRTISIGLRLMSLTALVGALLLVAAPAVAEDLGAPNPAVAQALDLVASTSASADLPAVLADHDVSIRFVGMAPNIYARYSVARRAIEIDSRWTDMDPRTLAAVIAHEATHARDAVNGYLASGGATACIDSEIRAFRVSAEVWLALFGPSGKADAQGELERQMNLIADRYARDPQGLDALVRQAYVDQCSTAGAPTPPAA